MGLHFSWDPAKASSNLRKHGIGFREASTIFGDPLSRTMHDPDHSVGERRYIIVGMADTGRLLVVSHTDHEDLIRLISARVATRLERRQYEEG